MESQAASHSLIKLKADVLKPRHVTYLCMALFFVTAGLYTLTIFVPATYLVSRRIDTDCPKDRTINNQFLCKPFNLQTSPSIAFALFGLKKENRLFWGSMEMVHKSNATKHSQTSHESVVSLIISIYEMDNNTGIIGTVYEGLEHDYNFECDIEEAGNEKCNSRNIFYVPHITAENYLILVNFTNSKELEHFETAKFEITKINDQYSVFLIALRYTCLGLSALAAAAYLWNSHKVPYKHWIYEQNYVLVLGGLIVLFNDPTAIVTLLYPTEIGAFFSTFFIINFVVGLLFFWITTFQRIWQENVSKKTKIFTIPKLVLMIIVWAFLVVTYALLNHYFLIDPGFNFADEYESVFSAFKHITIGIIVCLAAFLLYNIVRVVQCFETRIWRHKMLFLFSLYFICSYFIFILTGSYSIYNESGKQVLLVVSISNLYIWLLQFLYMPSEVGLKQLEELERRNKQNKRFNYNKIDEYELSEHHVDYEENAGLRRRQKSDSETARQSTSQEDFDPDALRPTHPSEYKHK